MKTKSVLIAGSLNFIFPGVGLGYLLGFGYGFLGVLAWITLLTLQLLALAGAVIEEMPGAAFWLALLLAHNICAGILAAKLAKRSGSTTGQ